MTCERNSGMSTHRPSLKPLLSEVSYLGPTSLRNCNKTFAMYHYKSCSEGREGPTDVGIFYASANRESSSDDYTDA